MKVVIKEFIRSLVFGAVIFIVLFTIALLNGRETVMDYGLVVNFLYTMLYSVVLYGGNAFIFYKFDKVYGRGRMTTRRLVLGFISSFSLSVLLIFLLRVFEDVVIEGESFNDFIADEDISNYSVAIIITLVISFLVHAFHFYRRYQENRIKEQKIIAGTASAKFETLKNQIDPHFLFNSLNVLSSLIEENPESAQKFTTSLSKVYRYVLEQRDKELVSVEEELSFAKTYMNLLKMRFENSVFFDLPEKVSSPDARVVPLSLQLLLENTVKHNIVSQNKPLHIKIFEKDGYLVVQNGFQKKEVLQDRRGVGLQNIVSRYAILTNRK
ncbi:MAG TPA: histidine kinase, partial [Flavobacterium sp.]|nr:histidine kinase [Flavobacterium sp.]